MISALKCLECKNGYIIPIDPMDLESNWKCRDCDFQQSAQTVEEIVHNYDCIYNNATSENDLELYEEMLKDFNQNLHPNHHISNDHYSIIYVSKITKKNFFF